MYHTDHAQQTLDAFRSYLTTCGHDTVAEALPSSSAPGFLCQIYVEGRSFLVKIRVDEAMAFAALDLYPGLTIQPPFFPMASAYATAQNSGRKAGTLQVDPIYGDLSCHVESSFASGPLTGEDLAGMERVAIGLFLSCEESLRRMSHGLPP